MKKFKDLKHKYIKEYHDFDYSPSKIKMNYNDYEGRMAKQNLYKMQNLGTLPVKLY